MKKRYRNRMSDEDREAKVKAMSPSERIHHPDWIKGLRAGETLAVYKSRRFLVPFVIALLPPTGCAIERIVVNHEFFGSATGLLIAAGAAACLIHSIISGMLSTNYGIYFGKTEPVRFWIQITILALAYFAAIFAILFAH